MMRRWTRTLLVAGTLSAALLFGQVIAGCDDPSGCPPKPPCPPDCGLSVPVLTVNPPADNTPVLPAQRRTIPWKIALSLLVQSSLILHR